MEYRNTIDIEPGSLQERFLEYAKDWDNEKKENLRVKIFYDNRNNYVSLEDSINNYIEENSLNIKIHDIKYIKSSVLLIYKLIH